MSDAPATTTASVLGSFHRELIAEGIGEELVYELVRDASSAIVRLTGEIRVKVDEEVGA